MGMTLVVAYENWLFALYDRSLEKAGRRQRLLRAFLLTIPIVETHARQRERERLAAACPPVYEPHLITWDRNATLAK